MTKKTQDEKAHNEKVEKAKNRISPDSPLGQSDVREDDDFYAKQRRESPDGMTAAERDQYQKAAPGALNQTSPDGERIGELEDEANPLGGTQQSGNGA
jgi:hypothetical protein